MNSAQCKTFLRTGLFAAALFFVLPALAQVSIGIRIGPPPAPRVVHFRPASPGPDFFWVEGYWYPVGNRYRWHEGYWARPPYVGARWIAARHDGERFFEGYWEGEHGRVDRDHPWTAEREREFRDHEHDRDRPREVREEEHDRDRDRYDRDRDRDDRDRDRDRDRDDRDRDRDHDR